MSNLCIDLKITKLLMKHTVRKTFSYCKYSFQGILKDAVKENTMAPIQDIFVGIVTKESLEVQGQLTFDSVKTILERTRKESKPTGEATADELISMFEAYAYPDCYQHMYQSYVTIKRRGNKLLMFSLITLNDNFTKYFSLGHSVY